MPTVSRGRAVTVSLDERRIVRTHKMPVGPLGDAVTIESLTADGEATTGPAPQIFVAIAGEIFNALENPSQYNYPDATNTGLVGVGNPALTTVNGKLEILDAQVEVNDVIMATRPGSGSVTWGPITLFPTRTDIDLMDLTGRIQMKSTLPLNVRRSGITANAGVSASRLVEYASPGVGAVLLEDCTLDAKQHSAAIYLNPCPVTVRRCNVQGGEDVMWLQGNGPTRVEDSYLHTPVRQAGSHNDMFQTGAVRNAQVNHCTLQLAVPGSGVQFPDGLWDPMNAIIMASNFAGTVGTSTVQGIIMNDCLVDGGNYSFQDNWQTVHAVHGITVQNCRIGRHFRFGVWSITNAPTDSAPPTWTRTGNVWDDTGEPV